MFSTTTSFLLVILSIITLHLDAATTYTVTLQQYQTIQLGWTQQQVTQLLNGPGTTTSQWGILGSTSYSITIQYLGSQSSSAIASFTFTSGKLFSRYQSGLDTGVYIITYQQFATIQIGWTRAQVTNLTGSSGIATSESGTASSANLNVQYKGSGTGSSTASFTFIGGQLNLKTANGLASALTSIITFQQYQTIQIG
ncbi:hypothetical protein I4U23_011000 [Adineta vaga]|nr:hypothetical protein I4U23_011000 [Adineta vaga]